MRLERDLDQIYDSMQIAILLMILKYFKLNF